MKSTKYYRRLIFLKGLAELSFEEMSHSLSPESAYWFDATEKLIKYLDKQIEEYYEIGDITKPDNN